MVVEFLNEIPPESYTDFIQIGSGSYSSIFSALHTKTNVRVALKISLKVNDEDKMKTIYQEHEIHKTLNHPFICRYYTSFETEHLFIVSMELIEGISLLEYVNQNRGLKIEDAQNIFGQLIIAMEYLHSEKNVTHRDLKLENIMVDRFNNIRLIDFGFSTPKLIMTTLCGSIPYCAPEILKGQAYTKEADIWCMGIILYSLVTDKLPFYSANMKKMINTICEQEPDYSLIKNQDLKDLLSKLLIKDQAQRIMMHDIKNHIFMSHVRILKIDYKTIFSPIPVIQSNFRRKRSASVMKPSMSNLNLSGLLASTSSSNNSSDFLPQKRLVPPDNGANQLIINNLRKLVTNNSTDVDELIGSRKDYPSNLNRLIETALLSIPQNKMKLNVSYINLKSVLPTSCTTLRQHRIYRNSLNTTFGSQSPLAEDSF